MRKLALVAMLLAAPATAHADLGIGVFLGEPTGLDLKIGLQSRSALDIVIGGASFRDVGLDYGHLTYLYTPFVGQGNAIAVPLRLGIGAAFFGNRDNIDIGVRAPLEVGLRFTRTPIELYGEIALLIVLSNDERIHGQGGVGIRFYF